MGALGGSRTLTPVGHALLRRARLPVTPPARGADTGTRTRPSALARPRSAAELHPRAARPRPRGDGPEPLLGAEPSKPSLRRTAGHRSERRRGSAPPGIRTPNLPVKSRLL